MRLPWPTSALGRRVTIILQLLFLIVAPYPHSTASTILLHPYPRADISSLAHCSSDYEWMQNQETTSPCLLVAYVISACAGTNWTLPALLPGSQYDGPAGQTVTPCSCSWSCYNLMMACTLCQSTNSSDGYNLQTWPAFVENCTSSETNVYFPSGYSIAGNQTIPYWAAINPTTWEGQIWNEQEAYQYYQENKTDLNPNVSTASTGSQSSNLGAIVGGTVGGAAFVLLLGFGTYILCKRQQYRRVRTPPVAEVNGGQNPNWQMHNCQLSDQSTATGLQPMTVSSMTYYTGTGSQTVPSLRSSLPLTSSTFGADTASYNTRGAQLRPPAPMV
ncbi:hypothetical protein BKA82DRAFT_4085472 [Pisolithus tinctorius]|nr:hypothetical protein BKA82DRAFT_4085472 [Pisolithus tinctorius]